MVESTWDPLVEPMPSGACPWQADIEAVGIVAMVAEATKNEATGAHPAFLSVSAKPESGFQSTRVNDPWRSVFRWTDAGPAEVSLRVASP